MYICEKNMQLPYAKDQISMLQLKDKLPLLNYHCTVYCQFIMSFKQFWKNKRCIHIEIHRLDTLVKFANLCTVFVIVEICFETQKTHVRW